VPSFLRSVCLLLAFVVPGCGFAASDEEDEVKQWQEEKIVLPASPTEASLLPFYVSAASENRFFIDVSTLSVGVDGVVRYTLVVVSPEGGRNVSFEGMRCETKERRIYASGRADGSWSESRVKQWAKIRDAYGNRQHAALFLEYFCPGGVIVRDAAEAREALRLGGHPETRRR